jgi:hypothetical protein
MFEARWVFDTEQLPVAIAESRLLGTNTSKRADIGRTRA